MVGFVGAIAGTFLATGISSFAWVDMAVWLPVALIAGLVAGVLAAAVRFALGRSARLGTAFVAVALIVLLGATWLAAIQDAGAPQAGGMSYAQYYAQEPAVSANMHDEGLYLLYVHRLAAGQPYYSMVARALVESNAVRDDVSVTSPLSYRLPTLYVLLSRLPQDGISYVLAALALGTATVLSAYALARLYMGPAFALVSATAVATYVASSAPTPALLHTEYWAGGLALVAVTLFAAASRSERRATALNVAAAVVAVVAVAFRELAIAFVVLGLIATLAFPEGRRARTWIAWAAGLVAASAHHRRSLDGGEWRDQRFERRRDDRCRRERLAAPRRQGTAGRNRSGVAHPGLARPCAVAALRTRAHRRIRGPARPRRAHDAPRLSGRRRGRDRVPLPGGHERCHGPLVLGRDDTANRDRDLDPRGVSAPGRRGAPARRASRAALRAATGRGYLRRISGRSRCILGVGAGPGDEKQRGEPWVGPPRNRSIDPATP